MANRLRNAAAAALLLFSAAAAATPITLTSGGTASFGIVDDNVGGYNLRSAGTVSLFSLNATTAVLDIHLENNSTLANGNPIATPSDVRLAVWGFAITPDVTAVGFSDPGDATGMVGAALGDIPSIHAIEVCAFGQNCSSGANLGVLAAAFDDFRLTLTGTFGSSIALDLLGVKWQTNVGSFEFSCSDCGGTTSSSGRGASGAVPEPSSTALALLGVALLGGTMMRRRSSQRG